MREEELCFESYLAAGGWFVKHVIGIETDNTNLLFSTHGTPARLTPTRRPFPPCTL